MSFEALKRSRGNFDKLTKELEVLNKPATSQNSSKDERFWRPELDKSGNGYAVIRFLPAVEGEELPMGKSMVNMLFQGPGGWYIENSLTTIGGKDPIGELNRELWNSGNEADKETVRNKSVNFLSTQISTWSRTLPTLRMKVRYSCTSLVRRSSTRSWKQCNLNSKMKLLSTPLTSGKVPTSNSN